MNNSSKLFPVLIGVLLLAVVGFGVFAINRTESRTTNNLVTPTPETLANASQLPATSPSPTVPSEYADWQLFRNGYALPIPPNWKNTSSTGGRTVLVPGDPVGSIQEITVTVVSDAKAPAGQQFTTQKEFDEWSAVEGEVQGNIQKIDALSIDSEPGLLLLDAGGGENDWKMIAWVRKDNTNLYITFTGNQKFSAVDARAVDHIASGFTFTAPPMTGREGKE